MSDSKKIEIGKQIAESLHLLELDGKYLTAQGKKTEIGIYDLLSDIMQLSNEPYCESCGCTEMLCGHNKRAY